LVEISDGDELVMRHALHGLAVAFLATLLALPVLAQPVDQETYDVMVRTRDQVADALHDVQWEQQELLDRYRSPDWVIWASGDRILTLDRDEVVARSSMLGVASGSVPASWPLVLTALKR